MTRVLVVEPYLAGSHRAWVEGYRAASRLDVSVLALPGRFWRWRMHGAAVTLGRMLARTDTRPDVVLSTDMLDVAAFVGLTRARLAGVPVALYMHENQLAYPAPAVDPAWTPSRQRRATNFDDAHYPFTNFTSMLAADRVLWNSRHNRDTFLERLPGFLKRFPDFRELGAVAAIRDRSDVLPLGLDLAALDGHAPAVPPGGPPRIVWNHRWEHDKGPEDFFHVLDELAGRGLAFEVIVLGAAFGRTPEVFDAARARLGRRILCFGFAESRAVYAAWLAAGDIVVSTARHDFFGAAVCEAAYCGCWPIVPHDLAYAEWIPRDLHAAALYDGVDACVDRLAALLTGAGRDPADRARLRTAAAGFDWTRMAPRYDACLEDLARAGGSDRLLY